MLSERASKNLLASMHRLLMLFVALEGFNFRRLKHPTVPVKIWIPGRELFVQSRLLLRLITVLLHELETSQHHDPLFGRGKLIILAE